MAADDGEAAMTGGNSACVPPWVAQYGQCSAVWSYRAGDFLIWSTEQISA